MKEIEQVAELSTFKYNMSSPSEENFLNKIKECSKQNYIINPNIFLSDYDFVNIIIEHFLGKNWYVCSPISNVQVNAEAMLEILDKYPKKTFFLKRYFRKLWNSLKKNYKNLSFDEYVERAKDRIYTIAYNNIKDCKKH